MANIQVFKYQNNKVRTVDVDGEAWFVLKDVCEILGISNHKMTAQRLDEDEVSQTYLTDSMGRQQSTTMEQLCLDGYSISWSKADNAISLWMLDEDSRNHSNTFCMTDPFYWNTWIGKCVCLCRATGREVPAFIVKKAGECW